MKVINEDKDEDDTDGKVHLNLDINPYRYNFIDLVDRPFCTEQDLNDFIKSN